MLNKKLELENHISSEIEECLRLLLKMIDNFQAAENEIFFISMGLLMVKNPGKYVNKENICIEGNYWPIPGQHFSFKLEIFSNKLLLTTNVYNVDIEGRYNNFNRGFLIPILTEDLELEDIETEGRYFEEEILYVKKCIKSKSEKKHIVITSDISNLRKTKSAKIDYDLKTLKDKLNNMMPYESEYKRKILKKKIKALEKLKGNIK